MFAPGSRRRRSQDEGAAHIEKDEVRPYLIGAFQSLFSARRHDDSKAMALETFDDHAQVGWRVTGDEDRGAVSVGTCTTDSIWNRRSDERE